MQTGQFDEQRMWRDAYLIADIGATNPVAVARTLHEHTAGFLHWDGNSAGMDGVRACPALRAITGHLAYLMGVACGPHPGDLETVRRECAARGIIAAPEPAPAP